MKSLSQLFAVQDTDSTSKSFSSAWLKLVFLYMIIIATVIVIFASLVVLQVNQEIDSQKLRPDSQIVINANEALIVARDLHPGGTIESAKYSLEDNTLLFKIIFDDGERINVDMLTGRADIDDEDEHGGAFFELLTDNIAKVIWWIGAGVFLLASIGSFIIVRFTLQPIAVSTKKQKRFVADAAHELRNPLASLQMTLESFLRSPQKTLELTQTVAEDMLGEVKRLVSTSESLLALEEVENRPKNISSVEVGKALEIVTKRLQTNLDAKGINLRTTIAKTPIMINQNDLETVLYNLLHNAIKFSKVGDAIDVKCNGKKLQVIDHGAGIPEQHIPHVFERFYKADSARSFDGHSNGLGLALVHDIIESYGGQVTVDSVRNEGTTFTIMFA